MSNENIVAPNFNKVSVNDHLAQLHAVNINMPKFDKDAFDEHLAQIQAENIARLHARLDAIRSSINEDTFSKEFRLSSPISRVSNIAAKAIVTVLGLVDDAKPELKMIARKWRDRISKK